MCGIYGYSGFRINEVKDLINFSSHRGPDGYDVWHDEKITLGQNLLAITEKPDLSNQPWVSDKGNVLIYNGEIFNYKELCSKFQSQFKPKTNCDTELLMWLLENKNIDDITNNLLDSMHAFAFYNIEKKKLYLSRDHAGIKPIYFSEFNQELIFSSEIKGLKKFIPSAKNINPQSLVCMAYCGMNFFRNTLFQGIMKVKPGETLIYDLNLKKFINSISNVVIPKSSKKMNIDEFNEEINIMISNTSIGIRKFGVFLSGGLDSSLLAYKLFQKFSNIETYTNFFTPNIVNAITDYNDDFNIAKKFCSQFEIKNHPVEITPDVILKNWSKSIHFMEEPRYNWNMPMYFYTNQFLSKNKTVVTISGDMGDELLGGYEKYYHFKNNPKQPKSWEELIYLWMHRFKKPINLNLKFNLNELHELLCKELPSQIWNPDDPLNSLMALDCITCVTEDFFSRNDKYGMAASMEGRFPFASKRFMNYALDIHSYEKIGNTKSDLKLPIKKSSRAFLPDYIINKKKTGWSLPITNWIESNQNLKQTYLNTIKQNDCLENIISPENYNFGKTRVISWMMRSWAQDFDLNINI